MKILCRMLHNLKFKTIMFLDNNTLLNTVLIKNMSYGIGAMFFLYKPHHKWEFDTFTPRYQHANDACWTVWKARFQRVLNSWTSCDQHVISIRYIPSLQSWECPCLEVWELYSKIQYTTFMMTLHSIKNIPLSQTLVH